MVCALRIAESLADEVGWGMKVPGSGWVVDSTSRKEFETATAALRLSKAHLESIRAELKATPLELGAA